MTTWEQRLAESERRQKAENILYVLKSYFDAKSGLVGNGERSMYER